MIWFKYIFWAGISEVMLLWSMILMNPGGGGVNFDHLIGVVPAGFLH